MFESRDPAVAHAEAYPRLLGDIGGTNARFGWQVHADAPITQVQVLPCAEHKSLLAAAQTYLSAQGLGTPPCAAFGIANPVTGDQVADDQSPLEVFSQRPARRFGGVALFVAQ